MGVVSNRCWLSGSSHGLWSVCTHTQPFVFRASKCSTGKKRPVRNIVEIFYLDNNREGMVCVCGLDFVSFPPLCTRYGLLFFVARCGRCALLAGLSLLDGLPILVLGARRAWLARELHGRRWCCCFFSAMQSVCMSKKKLNSSATPRNAMHCNATQNRDVNALVLYGERYFMRQQEGSSFCETCIPRTVVMGSLGSAVHPEQAG